MAIVRGYMPGLKQQSGTIVRGYMPGLKGGGQPTVSNISSPWQAPSVSSPWQAPSPRVGQPGGGMLPVSTPSFFGRTITGTPWQMPPAPTGYVPPGQEKWAQQGITGWRLPSGQEVKLGYPFTPGAAPIYGRQQQLPGAGDLASALGIEWPQAEAVSIPASPYEDILKEQAGRYKGVEDEYRKFMDFYRQTAERWGPRVEEIYPLWRKAAEQVPTAEDIANTEKAIAPTVESIQKAKAEKQQWWQAQGAAQGMLGSDAFNARIAEDLAKYDNEINTLRQNTLQLYPAQRFANLANVLGVGMTGEQAGYTGAMGALGGAAGALGGATGALGSAADINQNIAQLTAQAQQNAQALNQQRASTMAQLGQRQQEQQWTNYWNQRQLAAGKEAARAALKGGRQKKKGGLFGMGLGGLAGLLAAGTPIGWASLPWILGGAGVGGALGGSLSDIFS